MKDRLMLFSPRRVVPESDTFTIDYGKQMTIAAVGLQPGDTVTFQMVYVPSIDPDSNPCPRGPVELPSVAAYSELKCNGETIQLTEDNPVVILDNPQRMLLRAVLDAQDLDGIWVWALDSRTADVTDRMRGCA